MTAPELMTLLEITTCPECKDLGALVLRDASTDRIELWRQALKEQQPISRELECRNCSRTYPVTHDGIPVLWSDTLRETFTTLHHAINASAPSERDVKAANIHVYETIVDSYDKAGVHADTATRNRFHAALDLGTNHLKGWHVDIGCGGGNVLEMTNDTGLHPKVGVDVSLSALRVVKKKGFHVVVGDAENLPFYSSSVGLVTASSVLHHLYSPQRLMRESQRILKRDGLFFSDFDPNREAADWGWMARTLYRMRLPIYRLLAKWNPKKVGHTSKIVQVWNKVAEFHNHPGAGFAAETLTHDLEHAGFEVVLLLKHTTREGHVRPTHFVRPGKRAICSQLLSFRNPFLRKNADTILTLSRKPQSSASFSFEDIRAAG